MVSGLVVAGIVLVHGHFPPTPAPPLSPDTGPRALLQPTHGPGQETEHQPPALLIVQIDLNATICLCLVRRTLICLNNPPDSLRRDVMSW